MPEADKPAYEPGRYWNKRLEKDFSLAGAGHTGVGLSFNRWAYRVRRRVLLRVLCEQHVAIRGARVLELGFGTGFYLDLWRAEGVTHVTGFDIASVAVQAGRERHAAAGWRLEEADIGKPLPLGEAAGSFDVATAFDVLFHLVDDAAWNGALDNLAAGLKPGAHAVIFDKFQRAESAVSHVKRRTLATYREALGARGLEIVVVRPIFFFLNSPTDLTGLSRPLWKLAWSLAKLPYKVGRVVGLGEVLGGASGAVLYGPELALGRVFSSGPSTTVLVARKRQHP
jgi:2-polyprenyl-3-methyl-5-hydroxy-6-metoxy-1,4-benzoquinol methylase